MLCAPGQAVVLLGDAQQLFLEIVAHNYIRLGPRLLCPIVPVLRVQKNERMLFDMTNSLVNIRSSTVWKSLVQCRLDRGRLPVCHRIPDVVLHQRHYRRLQGYLDGNGSQKRATLAGRPSSCRRTLLRSTWFGRFIDGALT